jgi:FAD/FMN-containing dehydrogenase
MTAGYTSDWTGRWKGDCLCVVRPGTTEEVAAVLQACTRAGTAVVSQGGNTGLVGGAVPDSGQVLLSTARLDRLDPVDTVAAQVTVDAGVTLGALQRHALATGLEFAVDLTARDTATVGGMTATNAGGVHVIRYGGMRAQVTGVEAVLPPGDVVSRLSGLVKDNSGYDLAGLLCGSEGTLAVITRVRVRLVPHLPHRIAALLALPSTEAAMTVIARLRARLTSLEAAEITFRRELELVIEHTGLPRPFAVVPPVCLLIECADHHDPTEELADAIAASPEVIDTAVAADSAGRDRLWSWRESHSETVQRIGIPHKLDVTLPLARLAEFESAVRLRIAAVDPQATVVMWGHVGDGNLHVNFVGRPPDDETVDDAVLELVAEYGGSISAEHGIGRAKRRWLALTRSPADLAAMTAVRRAFDPNGLLNPSVLL